MNTFCVPCTTLLLQPGSSESSKGTCLEGPGNRRTPAGPCKRPERGGGLGGERMPPTFLSSCLNLLRILELCRMQTLQGSEPGRNDFSPSTSNPSWGKVLTCRGRHLTLPSALGARCTLRLGQVSQGGVLASRLIKPPLGQAGKKIRRSSEPAPCGDSDELEPFSMPPVIISYFHISLKRS